MPSQVNDKGWILHSLAQSRRFGPMTEDELRGYFRAGMVKSVDRLTAPGEHAMRPAAEVAAMLGENVPAGPPPPELAETPPPPSPPSPSPGPLSAGRAKDTSGEERAARAAAAMNIDIATLMATSAPTQRRPSWLLPAVAVGTLVVVLLVGLGMLRKLKSPAAQVPGGTAAYQPPEASDAGNAAPAPFVPGANSPSGPRLIPEGSAAAAPEAGDPEHDSKLIKAEQLQNARNWAGLAEFAQAWAASRPERNEPLQYLGIAYSGMGDHAKAVEALQKVSAREPANTQARTLLADAYMQSERSSDAAAMYKDLVAAAPRDARLWNNYGAALSASGQQTLAVAALETAVRLDPTFKQAWTNLANLYQAMGDSVRSQAAAANAR